MTDAPRSPPPVTSLHEAYVQELRTHAVELIRMGYARIDSTTFHSTEEDDITDELVGSMRSAKNDSTSPNWVDFYEIHEQRPQNVAGRRGKRRPKMDIELERNLRGFRPRLGFEAKRLGYRHTLNGYLGDEGLGAFVAGYYSTTHGDAGMLGYVQEESVTDWSSKLREQLSNDRRQLRFIDFDIEPDSNVDAKQPDCTSRHTTSVGASLRVIHLLLAFH